MTVACIPSARIFSASLSREVRSWSTSLKIGCALLLLIVMAAAFAPFIARYGPDFQNLDAVLQRPSYSHPLGTDSLGRDIFSRVLFGARLDLQIGFIATYVPATYGVLIGALAGYKGGKVDTVVMGVLNIAMAFPFLVLIIGILSILGPGIQNIYISVFLVAWTMYAQLARADMMVERTKDYMTAACILGFSTRRIILRHGLPNAISSSLVFSTSDFVLNILLVSGLSFLGLGVQPPTPEWGAMIAEGKDFLFQAWWICTMPGLAVVLTGTALSLIGDGLAQRLGDQHHRFV